MRRWRVDILRKHAEHLGIVNAPNAQEALAKAELQNLLLNELK